MEEEQSAIQLKQQQHLEEYRQERAGLDHLSWRQRKWALYRAHHGSYSRPSERRDSQQLRLALIIRGTCTRLLQGMLGTGSHSCVWVCVAPAAAFTGLAQRQRIASSG